MATRWVTAHIIVGTPTFEWCETCQFSEMAVFPLSLLSEAGVSNCGTYRRRLRCDPAEEC